MKKEIHGKIIECITNDGKETLSIDKVEKEFISTENGFTLHENILLDPQPTLLEAAVAHVEAEVEDLAVVERRDFLDLSDDDRNSLATALGLKLTNLNALA